MENAPVVEYWGTTTEVDDTGEAPLQNCALGSLLVRLTVKPPGGAAPVIVRVPVRLPAGQLPTPPCTAVALRVSAETVRALTGFMVIIVVTLPDVEPDRLAVSVTIVDAPAVPPTRMNDWLGDPAGTTTLAGTGSAVLLLLINWTVCPPAGAGMLSDTLHSSELPDVTEVCWQLIPARLIEGTISTTKVTAELFSDADSVTSVVFVTDEDDTVNCACVAPAGTATVAGTETGIGVPVGVAGFVNAVLSVTVSPLAGAGGVIVTVPVMLVPPAAVYGTTISELIEVGAGSTVIVTEAVLEFSDAVTVTVR